MIHYPIVIQKDAESDFSVAIPDLPGCVTAGETLDEALAMAQEAAELHAEGILGDGESLPQPRSIEEHRRNPDFDEGTWAIVTIDPVAIAADAARRHTYHFIVVLAGLREISRDLAEALFEAGCDDGSLGSIQGVAAVTFDRQAESFEQAIRSAIADVQKAGAQVARVEIAPGALAQY